MNTIIEFADITPNNRAIKKLAQAFTRAGAPVVSIDVEPKTRRTAGVSYRELHLTFADNQKITLAIKQSGDIWQIKLNGSVQPIKAQDDQMKAIPELVKLLEANRAKHQAKMARQKVALPKGIKTAAPRMEVALQAKVADLDTQIAEAKTTVNALREELGEPVLDSFNLDLARELAESIISGAVLDGVEHAVAVLTEALNVVTNNQPISEAEGDFEQAKLQAESAKSFRQALDILAGMPSYDPDDTESGGGYPHKSTLQASTGIGQCEKHHTKQVGVLDAAADKRDDDDELEEEALDNADEEEDEEDAEFDGDEYAENEDQNSLFDAVAPSAVGKKLSEISREYWQHIPLKEIFKAVESAGYTAVDDDGEPWEGMLTGRQGRTVIDLHKNGKLVREALAIQWYKMQSGKFEVNAYVA